MLARTRARKLKKLVTYRMIFINNMMLSVRQPMETLLRYKKLASLL